MSKLKSTKRHILIIKKLWQSKQVTFAEISDYLAKETELDGYYDFSMYRNARFNAM